MSMSRAAEYEPHVDFEAKSFQAISARPELICWELQPEWMISTMSEYSSCILVGGQC